MKSPLPLLSALLSLAPAPAAAQTAAAPLEAAAAVLAPAPVRYEIAFPNRVHHEAEVTIRLSDLDPGPVELRMSRTSPGRYALHEFAKNVYAFRATDGTGRELPVIRPDPHQWTVADHGGELTVTYTLFGDRADGTYAGIDETHAHLNIPATFMFARGLAERPVEVRFRVPEGSGWNVATQLVPTADPEVFLAPDFAYFMDSPTELADFDLREWTVAGPDGPQTLRVAMHHRDGPAALERYVEHARALAAEEAAVFGEYPEFDFGSYTFLACYVPWADGDGMEHRNSTVLTSATSLEENLVGLLGTVAHEFFHAWNMERIRDAALVPFDFEEADMSPGLWFGEGVTSYYDELAMVRAGVIDETVFAARLGAAVDAVVNGPGRAFFSPIGMSLQAPFVDAAVSVDPQNRANTFISYYTWGMFVGLALDLTLRAEPDGLTTDDWMRALWQRHGRTGIPYTTGDLEDALADLAGADFARDFFARYVRGRDVPDMAPLLARAGFRLHLAHPGTPVLARSGLTLARGGLHVTGATLIGSPAYDAGIDRDDLIVEVAGTAMDASGALERALAGKAPGDRVEVVWRSRGESRRATVALEQDPGLAVTPEERLAGGRLGDAQRAFRTRWLAPRRAP